MNPTPPLREIAPVPPCAGTWSSAREEVAATAVAVTIGAVPRTAAGTQRREPIAARIAAWPAGVVVALASVLVLCGVAGSMFLAGRAATLTSPEPAVTVPGSGLTIDKPAGWAEGPAEGAPAVLGDLVAGDATRRLPGTYLTGEGDRTLFVVHVPNSAQVTSVPPVPDRIGTASVVDQSETTHLLGPARSLRALGDAYELHATYVITGPRICLVGVFGSGGLSSHDIADYEAVLTSLRAS